MSDAGRPVYRRRKGVIARWAAAGITLLSLTPCLAQDSASAQPSSAAGESDGKARHEWLRGSFDFGVDFQTSDEDRDIDLNQSLRLQVDPPKHERLQLRTSLWMNEDLDGDERRTSVLRDINNASRSDVRARLLYLYLDVKDLWEGSVLRVGRQRIMEGLAFNRIDGVYFQKRHPQWTWYGFGGVRASIYDNASDDPALGAGVAYRPTYRTRLSLDLFYAEENRSSRDVVIRGPVTQILQLGFPRAVKRNISQTAVALSGSHEFTTHFRMFGRYLWKDGNGDVLRLSATGEATSWDMSYELAFRAQLNRAGDGVNDLTRFFRILGTFEPYYNVFVALHYPFTEKATLSFEGEFHEAENDDPRSANRDFERLGVILSLQDLYKGMDASVVLERWTVSGGESTFSVSGEVGRKWEQFDLTAGADFERYEDRVAAYDPTFRILDQLRLAFLPGAFAGFNPLLLLANPKIVETHENVYSLFARGKWAIRGDQDFRTAVTYEQDDGPDSPYWRLQAEYTLRF